MPASLCLIIATFLWGSSFISLKYAVGVYDPTVVIFLRMLTTLAVCLCLWRFVKRFEYQSGDWKYLLGMSLAEPCLYFLFEGHAMEYTSASQAGVIVSCLPLIVAFLAFFMLKEHISRAIIVGFTLCIGGSVLLTLVSPSSEQAPNPLLGNTLEFLAMICAAFYTVSVKRLCSRYAPLTLIALQGLAGSIFFAPFLLFVEMPQQHDPVAFAHILYLGTFVTLGGYGMYNYAISKVSVLTAAAYSNLIPIFTLLLSAIVLSEILTLWQWLSIAVVFVGVMISQRHQALVVDLDEEDISEADTSKRNSVPATGELKG
ncbi:DMT family transporter [Pseudoalteromonas sp. T1lg22]|uniref:DMT family transporter n=1 Tax=Pseudoalteromonas sp. T1lg22 TaxID=2077096 RepID=UPI000CF63E22|nr:DMT family transporter [Pseudoalteromonas sp. T1lg22]